MRTISNFFLNRCRKLEIALHYQLCSILILLVALTHTGCNNSPDSGYREISATELEDQTKAEITKTDANSINEKAVERSSAVTGSEILTVSQEDPEATNTPLEELPTISTTVGNETTSGVVPASSTSTTVSSEPREIELLIPENQFQKESQAWRVSFDDIDLLKILNMEPVPEDAVEHFPDWLADLNGKSVRIRGFMFPTLQQSGITYFQHVRDNEICCFGRNPKIYDRMGVVLKPGATTDYIEGRPYDIVGTFRIDPIYEDGEWFQLYLVEDAIVIP